MAFRKKQLLFIGTLAVFLLTLWRIQDAAFSKRSEPPPSQNKTLVVTPWYPFKEEPMTDVVVVTGEVRMTPEDARTYLDSRLYPFATTALNDPDELPYVRERIQEFLDYTCDTARPEVIAENTYDSHLRNAPIAIGEWTDTHTAFIAIHVPVWVEYDRSYVEPYVRDRFLEAVTHAIERKHAGLWKDGLTIGAKARGEASAWARTCTEVEIPFVEQGREPPMFKGPVCQEFEKSGSQSDAPTFLSYIGQRIAEQGDAAQ